MSEKLTVLVILCVCILSYWSYKYPNIFVVIDDE